VTEQNLLDNALELLVQAFRAADEVAGAREAKITRMCAE
jgi:hypothetical protein